MTRCLLASLLLAVFAGCATTTTRSPAPREERRSRETEPPPRLGKPGPPSGAERGIASFYADVLHGRLTANGERYDRDAPTCAHRTHRFGTMLQVTAVDTGRRVVCRVNDRGPFVRGRVVDLSRGLARKLGIIEQGVAEVVVEPKG